ncbi:helix-turn-helix domain-containing protein [Stenotrophomonas chelatiphaga]|uniref:helix-turn-helix domain-containing protein n=1 Tax=Stenotrophomonas chelatiphaga TaxID=517011 RepID=UPI003D0E54F9
MHVSAEDRAVVQIVLQVGKGARSMARRIGRRALTVSREIRRQEARSGSPPRRQELPRVPTEMCARPPPDRGNRALPVRSRSSRVLPIVCSTDCRQAACDPPDAPCQGMSPKTIYASIYAIRAETRQESLKGGRPAHHVRLS